MRRAVKGDDGYLRPYAEAERDEAAYAGGDVEILIAAAVKAIVLTIGNLGGAEAEDGELAAVGMAAQGKARAAVVADMSVPGPGIVLQHDAECRGSHAAHRAGIVGTVGQLKILLAGDDEGVTAAAYDAVLIAEQLPAAGTLIGNCLPAVGRLLCRRKPHIFGIVVIAQHREHPVARATAAGAARRA